MTPEALVETFVERHVTRSVVLQAMRSAVDVPVTSYRETALGRVWSCVVRIEPWEPSLQELIDADVSLRTLRVACKAKAAEIFDEVLEGE